VSLHSLDCRAATWVRWIVRGNGCLEVFFIYYHFCTDLWGFAFVVYWVKSLPPSRSLLFPSLHNNLSRIFFLFINDKHIVLLKNNSLLYISKIIIIIEKFFPYVFLFIFISYFLVFYFDKKKNSYARSNVVI